VPSWSLDMTKRCILSLALLVPLALAACKREAPAPGGPAAIRSGEGRGGRRREPEGHDRPPGHPRLHAGHDHAFALLEKDAALLQGVFPGDEITATLVSPTPATGSRTSSW